MPDYRQMMQTLQAPAPDMGTMYGFLEGMDASRNGPPLPQQKPSATALFAPGNIDLNNRPRVRNPDGSISTVRSMSINVDGKEVLIPTVSDDGRLLEPDEAIRLFEQSGKHLGVFDTPEHATTYAQRLHEQQEQQYAPAPAPSLPDTMHGLVPDASVRTPPGTGQGLAAFTQGLVDSAGQMVAVPRRVMEGEIDPMSDEAIQWAANTAMDFGTGGLATAPMRPGLGAFGGALWKKRGNFQELIHPAISKKYGVASLHKNADGTFEVMSPDGSSLGAFPDEATAKRAAESMADEMAPKMSGLSDEVPDEPVTPEQLEWLKQQQ